MTGSGARGTQERAVALRHAEAEFCLADCLLHGADGYEAHPAPPPPPTPTPRVLLRCAPAATGVLCAVRAP